MTREFFRRDFYRPLLLSALCLAVLGAAACSGKKTATNQNANATATAAPTPVDVTTIEAVARAVPSYLGATGSIAAQESSDIAPQAPGQIVATPVNVGAFVGQGAVVARLNDRDARLRIQQAKAAETQAVAGVRQAEARLGLTPNGTFTATEVPEVRAARQNYEAAQSQVKTVEAQIASAEAQARLAQSTAQRYANLVATGDTSRIVYDQQRTQAEAAQAQVNAVKAQADTARAQANAARQQLEAAQNTARQSNQAIATAEAAVEAARANTALAEKALADTVIRAPFAGYISDRPAALGEYVTTMSKIATIVRTNPIKAVLQIPEAEAGRLQIGLAVSINVAAYRERQFAGRITAINPALEATSRSVVVEAQIENAENLLRPGMFATSRIVRSGGGESIFVPRQAVMADEATNTFSVYVIEGESARARAVQIGQTENDNIEIVSGLSEGETVATSNTKQLFDGATVRRR